MLRALMAVYAAAALVLAAIWVFGVVDLFDPNFNEDRTLSDDFLIGQAASDSSVSLRRPSRAARASPSPVQRPAGGLHGSDGAASSRYLASSLWVFVLAGPAGSS